MKKNSDQEDFVTFDSRIPNEILESLNTSYEQISSTAEGTQGPTRLEAGTQYSEEPQNSQDMRPASRISHTTFLWLAILVCLAATALGWTCLQADGSRANVPPYPVHWDHSSPGRLVNFAGPSSLTKPVNLALKSSGAYIIQGYTTPPALSSWWSWSSRFQADPECMILPISQKCWPVAADAAIGLGLEKVSLIHLVKVRLFNSNSRSIDKELDSLPLVEKVLVYGIDADGQIQRIGASEPGSTFAEIDYAKVPGYAQIVVRIKLAGEKSMVSGCIRSIEVWGEPT